LRLFPDHRGWQPLRGDGQTYHRVGYCHIDHDPAAIVLGACEYYKPCVMRARVASAGPALEGVPQNYTVLKVTLRDGAGDRAPTPSGPRKNSTPRSRRRSFSEGGSEEPPRYNPPQAKQFRRPSRLAHRRSEASHHPPALKGRAHARHGPALRVGRLDAPCI
jgi:hypothetical protein